MLVVTRKVGERIQIGDQITLTVVRINGPAVRIGIDAPPDTSVVREELMQRRSEQPEIPDSARHAATI